MTAFRHQALLTIYLDRNLETFAMRYSESGCNYNKNKLNEKIAVFIKIFDWVCNIFSPHHKGFR